MENNNVKEKNQEKKFYKKSWFWTIIVLLILLIIGSNVPNQETQLSETQKNTIQETNKKEYQYISSTIEEKGTTKIDQELAEKTQKKKRH